MKRKSVWIGAFVLTLLGGQGVAQGASSSSMAVTINVAGSVSFVLQSDASGLSLTNSGTSAVTMALGTVAAYGGVLPTGVTRTLNGVLNWKVATPFDAVVAVANQTSANYTLTAQLQTLDAVNTWQVNTVTVTSVIASTVSSTATYGTTALTLTVTIPFTESAGTISNTLNFVATAN